MENPVLLCSAMSDSLQPHGLQPSRLLWPWDFPGKNTGVGCHFLLLPDPGIEPASPVPQKILIPDLFSLYNQKQTYLSPGNWDYLAKTKENGKASDCVGCGQCEEICPQHLPIRETLQKVAEQFE